jgi:hypothetical protein
VVLGMTSGSGLNSPVCLRLGAVPVPRAGSEPPSPVSEVRARCELAMLPGTEGHMGGTTELCQRMLAGMNCPTTATTLQSNLVMPTRQASTHTRTRTLGVWNTGAQALELTCRREGTGTEACSG